MAGFCLDIMRVPNSTSNEIKEQKKTELNSLHTDSMLAWFLLAAMVLTEKNLPQTRDCKLALIVPTANMAAVASRSAPGI